MPFETASDGTFILSKLCQESHWSNICSVSVNVISANATSGYAISIHSISDQPINIHPVFDCCKYLWCTITCCLFI